MRRRPVPRRLAILPGVVGLPLLFLLGMGPARHGIEDELTADAREVLRAEGHAGLEVTARGRDLHVRGLVATAGEQASVHALVRSLSGVRHVFDPQIEDTAPSAPRPDEAAAGRRSTTTAPTGGAAITTSTTGAAATSTSPNAPTSAAPRTTAPASVATTAVSAPPTTSPPTTVPATAAPTTTVAPAPPPATAPALPQVFVVYFDTDGELPNAGSQAALAQAVAVAQAAPAGTAVRVIGFADTSGDAARNLALSRLRAERVRHVLAAAAGALSYESSAQGADTAVSGDLAPARRVEIRLG